MLFLLVISNTKVAEIPGITVAGKNADLIKYTPPADAEYLFYDRPVCISTIPVTPEGFPTPGIITKAAKKLAHFPLMVVRVGSIVAPAIPYIHVSDTPGGNIIEQPGVSNFNQILNYAKLLAHEFSLTHESVMLAESIPGGTTTALAVLRGLGYNGQVSSASFKNPVKLKNSVVHRAIMRLNGKPLKWTTVIKELGDPMLAFMVGFAKEFVGKVYLAGGTQMLAVTAVLKEIDINVEKITTTKYIVDDSSATFIETAKELGVKYYAAPLDFSRSKYPGLRAYEKGIVKEGVGAGGAVYLATQQNIAIHHIVSTVESLYADLIK